jgi:hypothetical protein
MTPQALLDFLARRPVPIPPSGPAAPRCRNCGDDRRLIVEGELAVCWRCLYQLAGAAAHPERLTESERELLLEAHGDVVELRSYPALAWEHTGGDLDARIRQRLEAIAETSSPTAAARRHGGHDTDVAGCSYCAERSYWRRARI